MKIALTDDRWTYEPSYNLVKKAPSLAISRPMHGGKYKFGGWPSAELSNQPLLRND